MRCKTVIWLVYLFLCFSLCCGCADNNPNISSQQSTMPSSAKAQVLTYCENGTIINVDISPISNKTNALDSVVKSFIENKVEEITGERLMLTLAFEKVANAEEIYSDYWIDICASAFYGDNNECSIIFTGMLNRKTAAHPIYLHFALNIDCLTMERIRFQDIFAIDENLYDSFSTAAEAQIIGEIGEWPKEWRSFQEEICSKNDFIAGIQNEIEYSWYYSQNGVTIVYPVPHSMGDYKIVNIIPSKQAL